MKMQDEIAKRLYKHRTQCMQAEVDKKMHELLIQKAAYENELNRMSIAVESAGYPEFRSPSDQEIVNAVFNTILDIKRIDEQIDALEHTKSFFNLYVDNQVLKG